VKDVKIDETDPYIGDKNAPVTLVAWEDYQCPFCKAVEVGHDQIQVAPAMPELVRDYVKTGKLRIVFKDYPFLGDDSKIAALYEHAIWNLYPDKFYDWRMAMFEAQDEEGDEGFGDEASILALVKKQGMDTNKLKADVTTNVAKYQALVDADRAEGASFGITGTPGFITGKVLIPGAVGIDQFKAAIDAQL
jgi:protein-disulfide isomerase